MARTVNRRTRTRWWLPVAALVVLALVASCGDDDGGSGDDAADDPTTTAGGAEPEDFSARGPYEVGVVDLQLADRAVVVFYPAGDVPADAETYSYSGEEIFGADIAALLPGAFADEQPVDAAVDVPASDDGPFPVVLHSHGFGSYYRFSGRHNAQMASWGFVVAAVDHTERNLASQFLGGGGAGDDPDRDVDDLSATLDLLEAENGTAGGALEGAVDAEQVAVEGHSAGGSAAGLAAYDDRVDTWIGLAPAPPVPAEALPEGAPTSEPDLDAFFEANPPPDKPSMIIAADGDIAIPLERVESQWAWLPAPKRLVVLDQSGHNVFTDICAPIQEEGGLQQVIEQLGLGGNEGVVRLIELGEDGCTADNPPAEEGFALYDHLTVAQLRWVFGIDEPVAAASLEDAYLQEAFPDLIESYQVED